MSVMCKLFGHKVKTIRVNRWQMPTREGCERCGLIRNLEKSAAHLNFEWRYSDGRISEDAGIFMVHSIGFGELKCSNNT